MVLLLLPTILFAQSQNKKKRSVPAVFATARYVSVESMDGDIFTPGLSRADRLAIVEVQNGLRDWGRYALTTDRSQAELIFVVRTGRIAEGKVGGSVSGPVSGPVGNPGQQQHPMGTGVMLGSEVGPLDDLLKVCMASTDARLGTQVWMRTENSGLTRPEVPLLQQLRTAVEHDYPR